MTTIRRLALVALCAAALVPGPVRAQEAAACLSSDPSVWPAPSKPYFMVVADTSGSMVADVGTSSSCGFGNTRLGHMRCAVRNAIQSYAGQVNLGLATFDVLQSACAAACTCLPSDPYCFVECSATCYQSETNTRGFCAGCGPRPGDPTTASGALVRVPLLQDHFWSNPPDFSNVAALLQWVDNSCSLDAELFATGNTPLNGALRDMRRYFAGTYVTADGAITFPSPLAAQDLTGTGVNGSTGCRSVNVILLTDGDETCDTQADAVSAANALYQTGVTVGGKSFKIRVHVINFAGGNQVNTDQIAAAGGTGSSYFATNEVQLSQALASIVASTVPAESCDNRDNNCNGCTDEGFTHYADVGQTCCAWATTPQRTTCIATYTATVTPANPRGDLTKLPCTTVPQAAQPANWLCFDPGESCDNVDNNANGTVDEGLRKCGSPLHCPQVETCNGLDDDCDGVIDNGVCGTCVPSSEVCDGCDNDCDGVADDGIPSVPCGAASPANCVGVMACAPKAAGTPGGCVAGNPWSTCSNAPQTEVCDGVDNNCNGVVDDGVAATPCVPPGTPGGLIYKDTSPTSQCVKGTKVSCSTQCVGFVGPSAEVCDGIDNDCDGQVDEVAIGIGQSCGLTTPPCSPGVTACVNGALICQGGVGPRAEVCDGIDNDCDGAIDDAPLADGPAAGQNGCWVGAGSCCSFPMVNPTLQWCPPPGATCNGAGTLAAPCNAGTLRCAGAQWTCAGAHQPSSETCDGIDNDCNGLADDGIAVAGTVCGTDEGECSGGFYTCSASGLECSGVGPVAESCDGKDNDCNGLIDEGLDCGEAAVCSRVTCPPDATCALRGGGAVCVKTETTTSGGCGSAGGLGGGGEGALLLAALGLLLRRGRREGRGAAVSAGWSTRAGPLLVAAALGLSGCGETTSTKEVEVAPLAINCTQSNGGAEACDGLDNDCNGVVDDLTASSDPSVGVACQGSLNGVCAESAHAGLSGCVAGKVVCSGADVVRPYERTESCNGLDDDCNGAVDDAPADAGAACGSSNVFPCLRGALQCQGGGLVCVGAIEPGVESCNGVDDDCSGVIDDNLPAAESGGACNVPATPPAGATSPCLAGTSACVGGAVTCQGSVGPTGFSDACGDDANCDGQLTNQPNLATDVNNCGACGNDCYAGAVHALWGCPSGGCVFQGCQPGYWDLDGNGTCEYACTFISAQEACNGVDDNCNGQVDEPTAMVGAPSPAQLCGVSPSGAAPECSPFGAVGNPGGVIVACVAGGWRCTFNTPGVCSPSCAAATEICDTLDNDCDGLLNENVVGYGQPCASDDGLPPPGDGACRTMGTRVCNGPSAAVCSATKNLAAAGPEYCDGIDNDCDGVVDEPFTAKGANATYFVKPAVTKIGAATWVHTYEASRPTATVTVPGTGNGFFTSAPAGSTIDKTPACSAPGKIPWANVTPREVEQTCVAMGGHVCTTAEWQGGCGTPTPCTWGYNPRNAACTSSYTASKFCNLAPSYDFNAVVAGDQDGLLPTASSTLQNCWADWSALQGNTAATNKLYDVTGNLREITKTGVNDYRLMGGSFLTQSDQGATCSYSFYSVADTFSHFDTGFRCCFNADPGL